MTHTINVQAHLHLEELGRFLLDNRFVKVNATTNGTLTDVCVRFADCQPLKPYHVVTLACLLEEYFLEGVPVDFELTDNVSCRYLQGIGFFSRWQPGINRSVVTECEDPTTLSLWLVDRDRIDAYIANVRAYLNRTLPMGKDLTVVATCFGELFNNIADHAYPVGATQRVAYALTQYYPNSHRLMLTVSDFGRGITRTVNAYLHQQGQPELSPVGAVKKAIEDNFSSRSQPHNRGRGLATLHSIVSSLSGRLIILTDYALYQYLGSLGTTQTFTYPESLFPGTTVTVVLDTQRFEAADAEQFSDELCF